MNEWDNYWRRQQRERRLQPWPRPINWAALRETAAEKWRGRAGAALRWLMVLVLLASLTGWLAGCGLRQLGPETSVYAETPCGVFEYRSSKDYAAPMAVCEVSPSGAASLKVGADEAKGVGAVAGAIMDATIKAMGMMK